MSGAGRLHDHKHKVSYPPIRSIMSKPSAVVPSHTEADEIDALTSPYADQRSSSSVPTAQQQPPDANDHDHDHNDHDHDHNTSDLEDETLLEDLDNGTAGFNMEAFREKRMAQLRSEAARERNEVDRDARAAPGGGNANYRGRYTEVKTEKELLHISSSEANCLIHFAHPDFKRCALMDRHLEVRVGS